MNAVATADRSGWRSISPSTTRCRPSLKRRSRSRQSSARQLVSDQITTLFQNKLRSQLDVSFADANLAQAKLLLLDAQNNYQAALSTSRRCWATRRSSSSNWSTPKPRSTPPPDAVEPVGRRRLQQPSRDCGAETTNTRPRSISEGRTRLCCSQRRCPRRRGRTPLAAPVNGVSPFHQLVWRRRRERQHSDLQRLSLSGALEGSACARRPTEQLRDLKDRIANDVRTSWLNAITAYNRIGVTQQFVDQTNLALNLSQTRYNLGLSSIVELSQAQLQQTQAQIQFAAAKYQYRSRSRCCASRSRRPRF